MLLLDFQNFLYIIKYMDKKKPVYSHGELSKVRERLGNINPQEASRMAKLLGGEVGVEHPGNPKPILRSPKSAKNSPSTSMQKQDEEQKTSSSSKSEKTNSSLLEDDININIKARYFDRVRIDRCMAYAEFDIKTPLQVFISRLSIFKAPTDYVNPIFVQKRMNEYYKTLEQLIISTRKLFPNTNQHIDEMLNKISPLAFSILNTIRSSNIEAVGTELTRIQAHPRHVIVSDFVIILQEIYRPLFILDALDIEIHIKAAFLLLHKLLLEQEDSGDSDVLSVSIQKLIGTAISAYNTIRSDIHYLLYPLLLKLLSKKFFDYEQFFMVCRDQYMEFLHVKEEDLLKPEDIPTDLVKDEEGTSEEQDREGAVSTNQIEQERVEQESKAVQQGLQIMDIFFPKSGWKDIAQFPDIYHYFSGIFDLKHGYEFIASDDPLLHVIVLMNVIQNMFFGMRFLKFKAASNSNSLETDLTVIINKWRGYLDTTINKEYLPRLNEYSIIFENNANNSKGSVYVRRIYSELQWIRRLFFFPYYTFDMKFSSPFKKEEVINVYAEIRKLRRILTSIACEINPSNKQSPCIVSNVCEHYNFQIANPISVRMNILISDKKRTNALLIFFTLSIVMVLDHIVNNVNSWAYEDHPYFLVRSSNNKITDNKIDTDLIFRQSLKAGAGPAAGPALHP